AEHGLHPPVEPARVACCGECGPGLCYVDARNGETFTGRGAEPPAAPADPPPVGEGAALIAATEQEIADLCDEWIGVTRLAKQRDAWAETAVLLAKALDGRPNATHADETAL